MHALFAALVHVQRQARADAGEAVPAESELALLTDGGPCVPGSRWWGTP